MAVRLSLETLSHLKASGLSSLVIEAAQIRDSLTDTETAELFERHHAKGYIIPYFDIQGAVNGHYRIRVLQGRPNTPKYLQPAKTGNHLYLPPALPGGWARDSTLPLIITEGEKKALAATQAGLACVGLGGIDSWRTRTFRVPAATISRASVKSDSDILIQLTGQQTKIARELESAVAPELLDILWTDRPVIIIFDSDTTTNPEVQRAAFELGIWLDGQGALPGQFFLESNNDRKVGLDDYLLDSKNAKTLREFLEDPEVIFPFPTPHNPKAWVQHELGERVVARDRQRRVARGALAYLDGVGRRYRDKSDNYYFFEDATKVLHPFRLDNLNQLRQTSFGSFLINQLGMQTADISVMSRLADLFTSTQIVTDVDPKKVVTTKGDVLYYQISDGRIARVDKEGITFVDNGTDGQLFLPDSVRPIPEDALSKVLRNPIRPTRWLEALATVNLRPMGSLTISQTRELIAALFYLSPWFNRWRGMMPPLEIAVAEPGSGKTFLYNLRRGILTGSPDLEGLQDDFRGWVSSISAAPAMWVCDNLGSVRTDFWHRLNDELARLVTDPNPSIELRRLYTTSTVSRVPIQTTFAITSIKNPFTAPDILQRAFIFELEAIPVNRRNSNWYVAQLEDRIGWLAEHLTVAERFLKGVARKWDPNYISGYRLVHFEQALLRMGEVLGFDDMPQIVQALPSVVSSAVAEYDPVIEAIVQFVAEWRTTYATISDVVDWAQNDWERRFSNIKVLQNTILLGRYLKSHTYDVEQAAGVVIDRSHNKTGLIIPEGPPVV